MGNLESPKSHRNETAFIYREPDNILIYYRYLGWAFSGLLTDGGQGGGGGGVQKGPPSLNSVTHKRL